MKLRTLMEELEYENEFNKLFGSILESDSILDEGLIDSIKEKFNTVKAKFNILKGKYKLSSISSFKGKSEESVWDLIKKIGIDNGKTAEDVAYFKEKYGNKIHELFIRAEKISKKPSGSVEEMSDKIGVLGGSVMGLAAFTTLFSGHYGASLLFFGMLLTVLVTLLAPNFVAAGRDMKIQS